MPLAELLSGLMAESDRDAVIKGLMEQAHPIYQAIFDVGHSTATAAKDKDVAKLTKDLTTVRAELTKAQEAHGDKGEAAWQQEREKLLKENQDLQQAVADAKTEARETIKAERHERALSDFTTKLIGMKVDPDMARVKASLKEIRDRVQPQDDNSVKVMQAGKTIPYAPSGGKDALDLLAEEVFATVDKKFIGASGDRGSNQQNRGVESGGDGTYLSKLKEQLVKEREAQAKTATETLDERLRRVAPAP